LKEIYRQAVILLQQRHIDPGIGNPGAAGQENKQVAAQVGQGQ